MKAEKRGFFERKTFQHLEIYTRFEVRLRTEDLSYTRE